MKKLIRIKYDENIMGRLSKIKKPLNEWFFYLVVAVSPILYIIKNFGMF